MTPARYVTADARAETADEVCGIICDVAEAYTMTTPANRIGGALLCLFAFLLGLCMADVAVAQTSADPAEELMKEGGADLGARKYDDAMKAFKKANQLRHDSCADCLLEMAIAESKTGDFDRALKDCDKAIACATTDSVRVMSHALKGNILQNVEPDPKRLKASEGEYRAAIALDADNAAAHLNLGIVLLRESQQADGIAELNSYLKIAPNGPDAVYAKKLIEKPKEAGRALAPQFEVTTLNGDVFALDQLVGKVVVMDFWATWCPPCRESVPELKALTQKYPHDKLVVVSFSADNDEQAWKSFIAQKNMDWAQYWDHDGRIRDKFGVNAFPTYLVIDPDGFVYKRIVGLNPQMSVVGQLKDALKVILPE
jgi:thiol-disulfide isomerase/thioredoxin